MPTRTILLVEDDPNDEQLTLRALRQSGVPNTSVVAHTAQEALDYLGRSGPFVGLDSPVPLVIFVDHALPGRSGPALVADIRSLSRCRTVPVVVFSGSSDGQAVEKCLRAGANSFLEKPVEMGEYMQLIANAARYWLDINLSPREIRSKASAL